MSSWRGHMVVGAMVGYAGAVVIVGHPRTASEVGRTVGLMAASAVLATLPDLDTRHSIASRGARLILVIGMIALGGMLGYRGFVSHAGPHETVMSFDLIVRPYGAAAVIAGMVLGAILSPLLALVLGGILRRVVGGHRALTHDVGLAVVLLGLGAVLWRLNQRMIAGVPLVCAYATLIHDIADCVTPRGVPVLGRWRLRLLPLPLAHHGEAIVVTVWCGIASALTWFGYS